MEPSLLQVNAPSFPTSLYIHLHLYLLIPYNAVVLLLAVQGLAAAKIPGILSKAGCWEELQLCSRSSPSCKTNIPAFTAPSRLSNPQIAVITHPGGATNPRLRGNKNNKFSA